MKRKGTKKATHHTLSLFPPIMPPEAPAALGAGGIPVFCESPVEMAVEDVLRVDPAASALEGSGVGLVMGVAEPRDADGSYENGGEVGNSVEEVPEDTEDVIVTVERTVESEGGV